MNTKGGYGMALFFGLVVALFIVFVLWQKGVL